MLLFSFALVGCQKDTPVEDTTKVNSPANQQDNPDDKEVTTVDTNSTPVVDEESQNKIKELETALESKDKQLEELNGKVQELTDELNKKKEDEVKPTTTTTSKKLYRVVTGSFAKKENAIKKRDELKGKGFDAFISADNGHYRVIAGSYSQLKNANIKKDMLKKAGFESFVISN